MAHYDRDDLIDFVNNRTELTVERNEHGEYVFDDEGLGVSWRFLRGAVCRRLGIHGWDLHRRMLYYFGDDDDLHRDMVRSIERMFTAREPLNGRIGMSRPELFDGLGRNLVEVMEDAAAELRALREFRESVGKAQDWCSKKVGGD